MVTLFAFCVGVVLCAWSPTLPPWPALLALAALLWPWRRHRAWLPALLALCLGVGYAGWCAEQRLALRLDPALQGVAVELDGVVRGIADPVAHGQRLRLAVEQVRTPGVALPPLLELYDNRGAAWPAGSRWRLTVRLKAPHGAANVAGFDAGRWYWSEGVLASGSIAKGRQALPVNGWDARAGLDRLRQRLLSRLAPQQGRDTALVAALALGAQQDIAADDWQRLAASGLTHIVSVSGLHITLLATLVMLLCRRLLQPWPQCRPRQLALLAGCAAALGYALLAGFSVPTQRTVWMLLTAALALWRTRALSALQVWLAALTVVLLIDPFAALAPGFWLSFGLVGALIAGELGLRQRPGRYLAALLAQWRVTLAALLPLALLFGQFPLASPAANLVAIPLVSLLLTPLSLLAAALPLDALLWLAQAVAWLFWWWADALASWPQWSFPALPWPLWPAALAGTLCLILPLGGSWRGAGVLLLLPLVLYRAPRPAAGELLVEVIDVGQGLSVLLQTASHDVLFDTGAGEATRALLPVLRARGVQRLDGLLLSHHDSDHDGAAASLLAVLPVRQLWRGQAASAAAHAGLPCRAGDSWAWDGVRFDVLWPRPDSAGEDNALSCVLRVATARQAVMISGDAPQAVEQALLARYGRQLASTVLVLGHHGSRSASSDAWLDGLRPAHAIVSAGYRNRYRHPHREVVDKLAARGVRLWRTDRDGAIRLHLGAGATVLARRDEAAAYWAAR